MIASIFEHPGMPGHAAPRRGLVPLSHLWFGIFGGPFVWAVQLLVDFALVAHFCYPNDTPIATPTFGGVRAVALVVSAICSLVSVAALFTALRSWRITRHGRECEHREVAEVGEGRARFMALAGLLVSGIFIYAVLMNALPIVTLPICILS